MLNVNREDLKSRLVKRRETKEIKEACGEKVTHVDAVGEAEVGNSLVAAQRKQHLPRTHPEVRHPSIDLPNGLPVGNLVARTSAIGVVSIAALAVVAARTVADEGATENHASYEPPT